MSQRVEKVASVIQQVVAGALKELVPEYTAQLTVTVVEVSPDLRHATVWLGLLAGDEAKIMQAVENVRREIQGVVAKNLTTKFTPRLIFRHDGSGEYAAHIDKLIKDI